MSNPTTNEPVEAFLRTVTSADVASCDAWADDVTTVMCGGRWPAALFARMEEAAHV